MKKLLTVVVPVYKVEPYINKCLDSLILDDDNLMNQLEVIIVNDGTPDRSAEMSREYVKRYPQTFRQIDKENGGHGSAWNVGLKEATGKYLRFLDSDDWLTNLGEFMRRLKEEVADCVITNQLVYDEKTKKTKERRMKKNGDGVLGKMEQFSFDDFDGATDTFLFLYCTYKTSLLQPLYPLFMEKVMYDDSILYAIPILFADTFVWYDLYLYNYLSGREGQTMSADVQRHNVDKLVRVYRRDMEFIEKRRKGVSGSRNRQINRVMASDSCYLVDKLVYLPYKQFKQTIMELGQYFHFEEKEWRRSKQAIRFMKYPMWLFYLTERLRRLKNK